MKNDKNELPAKGLHPPEVESFVPMYPARKIKWDDESTYSYIPEDAPIVLWAWEFLRRNRLFQQYVDKSVLGKNPDFKGPPIKPPPQWGLVGLKHYKEQYGKGRIPEPSWLLTEPVEMIFRTSAMSLRHGNKEHPLTLEAGQVAVVFDLNHGLLHPNFLKIQIDTARSVLDEQLKRYSKVRPPEIEFTDVKRKKLLTYLRIADAMSGINRPSSQEIARTVLGDRYRDESEVGPMDLQKAIHPQIKATRKLIYERGYLRFLLKE